MSIPAVQRANEQRPRRVAGPLCSCIHDSWRWRELNPRPTLLREGFSGRSSLCPYSAPPVPRTSWCDRPSRCLLSLKIPRPDLLVIPLAGARIRVGRTPGLTDSLLAQAARAKSVRLEFALDFLQRMVNEIIVAFLGPLHLTGQTLSKPITPMGRTALPAYLLGRWCDRPLPGQSVMPLERRPAYRSSSRLASRLAMVWRLSYSFLPRARPSSTFTLPSVKYSDSGINANPPSRSRPAILSISSRCISSLRARRGAWLVQVPSAYSA